MISSTVLCLSLRLSTAKDDMWIKLKLRIYIGLHYCMNAAIAVRRLHALLSGYGVYDFVLYRIVLAHESTFLHCRPILMHC